MNLMNGTTTTGAYNLTICETDGCVVDLAQREIQTTARLLNSSSPHIQKPRDDGAGECLACIVITHL